MANAPQKNPRRIEFWNAVASRIGGYDFSKLKITQVGENAEKDFRETVYGVIGKSKSVIDIGTADGRFLISMGGRVKRAVGVDLSESMIRETRRNLRKSGLENVEFRVADGSNLPFEKDSFDLVISRRGPVTSSKRFLREAKRVLKRGGHLVEITIGENDKANIKKIFRRGQNFSQLMKKKSESSRKSRMLKSEGFSVEKVRDIDCDEYYQSIDDIVFLLQNTPIIPNFDIKKDFHKVEEFCSKFLTRKGIKTNSHRIVMKALKL